MFSLPGLIMVIVPDSGKSVMSVGKETVGFCSENSSSSLAVWEVEATTRPPEVENSSMSSAILVTSPMYLGGELNGRTCIS